jgi:predicted dinucleotide-binding enzyme
LSEVFYAGDEAGAKDTVRRLAGSIGFEPVDGGPLANARYLEPLGMLNIWLGYVGGRGTKSRPVGHRTVGGPWRCLRQPCRQSP